MAPKASVLKRPSAAHSRGADARTPNKKPAAAATARSRTPRAPKALAKKAAKSVPEAPQEQEVPEELRQLKGFIVNLERRPDRWTRVEGMLRAEVPWLEFEQFKASDGTQKPIPEEEIAMTWSTTRNSHFADYYEWVHDAPGTPEDGKVWRWAAEVPGEDDEEWRFEEEAEEEFSYIHHAPTFEQDPVRKGTATNLATGEKFPMRLVFAERCREPGEVQKMSGGERGCAHSHLRLWREAAEREQNTLVLEDDVHVLFDRTGDLGQSNGKIFTDRLSLALKHAPADFDVIYLGWSGWREGNYKHADFVGAKTPLPEEALPYIRRAEYVWTTVAYVISQAGAKKLLEAAQPLDQPVDNFMAWEASQGRLNSYVAVDEGDEDSTWAGGIVDQFDFQGDSDIKKSDGGVQGDDAKEFAVGQDLAAQGA